MSSTNLEEAASVASEFISSLENLPAEVQHLLAEMKHKDARSQELQQDIQKEGARYVRHVLKLPPNQAPAAKDVAIQAQVQAHYAEIDRLSQEKEQLAERIVQLVARARARLDCDLSRVLTLQGESDHSIPATYYYGASRNPVTQLNESLRSAIAVPEVPSTPVSAPQGAPPLKKRRVAAAASAGSIKLPSPAPVQVPAVTSTGGTTQRSRLSQQVHVPTTTGRGRRATASVGPEADEDAEGEDDIEEDAMDDSGDAEDKELYCFCQKLSYGEMIACDNPDCFYQWFHLPCVNLKPPLPDRWFCDACITRFGNSTGGSERRKGRKK